MPAPQNQQFFCIHGIDLDCRCFACDDVNSDDIEERLESVWTSYQIHRKIIWTLVVCIVLYLLIIIVLIS